MHILVYMYVFIYRKLESFFYFDAIYIHEKNGRHGFYWGSGAASARSNQFSRGFFSRAAKLEVVQWM